MKLSITIRETDLLVRANHFIVVQVQNSSLSTKFRTEIIANSVSPKFYKNIFRFKDLKSSLGIAVKLGLFNTTLNYQPQDETQVLQHSKYLGLANLKLSTQQIYDLKEKQYQSYDIKFVNGKNYMGKVTFELRVEYLETLVQNQRENKELQDIEFNPYQTNEYLISSNINKLQQLVQMRLQQYDQLRNKWISITNTQKKVDLTEIKLKDHVEKLQTYNLQLNAELNSKIDVQTMLASIELLKDTSKGQLILVQKVDYLKERLGMEKQQHSELARRFKEIEPEISEKIEKVERYDQLVRDVKDQQFQIDRNNQLLKIYDERIQKLRANNYAIKSLREGLKRSDLTAKQALILLQDAKYKAKLQEYTKKEKVKVNHQKSIDILQMIEGAAKVIDKEQEEFQFVQPFEFKLQALRNEINQLDSKIKQRRN